MTRPKHTNKFGLAAAEFACRLERIRKDINSYRPDELARVLAKLAYKADKQVAVTTVESLEVKEVCK